MKLRQTETSLDRRSRRVTRSSSESVHNTELIKKLPKSTRNNNINSKKGTKSGPFLAKSCLEKKANSIPLDDIGSNRRIITQSSFGSITGSLLKKPKLVTEFETKSSKRLMKPNQTQQQNNFGKTKKSKLLPSSIPVCKVDDNSSVSQSAVQHTKSKSRSKKKSDVVILSKAQSTGNRQKSKSVVNERDSSVPKDERRVTRSSLNNAANSLSTHENKPEYKLSASPVVQNAEKQVKVKKRKASREKLSLEKEGSKLKTRSSLANSNCSSVSLRHKSPRGKSPTKPVVLPNPGKQTKKKSIPENKKLGRATKISQSFNSTLIVKETSEPILVFSPESSPKKALPKETSENTHSVQRASRSSKLPNTSVPPSALEITQNTHNKNNAVKPTNTRSKRSPVLSTPIASSSETRNRSASSRSGPSSAPETEEKNPANAKMPRGMKRKSSTPPAKETKRKRNTPSITLASTTKDPVSSMDTLTGGKSKKHTRRHTVDVLPKTVSTTQPKSRKKSSSVKRTKAGGTTVKKLSSRFTPDISMLPLDAISTFTTKRPKSAPAAIKKQSLSKGSTSIIPKKGTLKRKRWLTNALKEKNNSYEDDIFENQKFASPFKIPTEADDESDTSIATPKFGFFLTPAVAKRTPKFKDIISPSDLVKARKNAEEYLYRRQNRNNKNKLITLKTPASSQTKAPTKLGQIPEKKKLEFVEAMDKIQTIKSTIEAKAAEESDEDDDYFSDLST